MRSLSCDRGTTWSTKPCSSRNSARWKPVGSFSPIVSLVTRAPEKPMSAPGSARTMSPSDANEASTPPVVGSVSTVTNGMPAASRRAIAPIVLAICMSAIVPSCSRDPLGIRLAVDEAERIGRGEIGVGLPERARVRQDLDALLCPELEVVPALRAHVEVPRELLVEQHLAAARALRPQVRGEFLRPSAERVAKPHASGGASPPHPPKGLPLPDGTTRVQ